MHFQEIVREGVDGIAGVEGRKQWRICVNTV